MASGTVTTRIELPTRDLHHVHETPIVTTCYLDVDGAERPRRADCLAALSALAQQARRDADALEPEIRTAIDRNLAMLGRLLDESLDRSRTRGLVMVCCALDSWHRTIALPVRVRDQIVSGHGPDLLQLDRVLGRARRFGVALVDHEKMRMFEYQLGQLWEYPALFDGTAPHRDRQRGWNVSSSPSRTGDAAARWASAGSHVDRHEVATSEHHLARCAAALAEHLDEHPVDHLILGGPTPEAERLERELPERHRLRVVAGVAVRVNAPLDEIRAVISGPVLEAEQQDDEALRSELMSAVGDGLAVLGRDPVLVALSQGRVRRLFIATEMRSQPGSRCTKCMALSSTASICAQCGAPADPVDDVVEAAVERMAGDGGCRFVPGEYLPAADGFAAIVRY
ncbi:MAG: hypothetical protein WCB51_04060 [Candidatus Dormiibacterota bacterium]